MAQGPRAIKYSSKKSQEEVVIPDVRSCFCDSRFHLVGYFQSGKSTDSDHFAFYLTVCVGKGLMLACMLILNREHSNLQLPKTNLFKAEFSIVLVVEYFSIHQKH